MAATDRHRFSRIRIQGLVQGVGFRPTVWRIARDMKLNGEVLNDGEGVTVHIAGDKAVAENLLTEIRGQCPPLARIDAAEVEAAAGVGPFDGFHIAKSHHEGKSAGIVADAATCPACIRDIEDPAGRRAGYAFTNCTHCGPRLSIIQAIPYDRENTSMAPFTMCPDCRAEYDDPADRRFHAQPNACPVCGPKVWFEDADGTPTEAAPITEAARRLKRGDILAIKGIGGFHLACDATNADAVAALRARKRRPNKPFALMAKSMAEIELYCALSAAERESLSSSAAPIVLLSRTHGGAALPHGLAPGSNQLGFMLPYSPLHHLLMQALDGPIVLTSGNLTSEPQATDNADARARLASIADGYVMHDRDIVNRVDDSVVSHAPSGITVMRRARGMAPEPFRVAIHADKPILALGGELKSSFCLLKGNQAILSQHIGDLDEPLTFDDYRKMLGLYLQLYDFRPEIIAVDSHPDFKAHGLGHQLAADLGAAVVPIQHHEAHFAACLGEHGMGVADKALGIVLDGFGLGPDGAIWGGEFFIGTTKRMQHVAQFQPRALLGGDKAMQEPWRNAYAHIMPHLSAAAKAKHADLPIFRLFSQKQTAILDRMMEQKLNSPLSSSAGRLFDAVSAALGVCMERQTYEGQAAIELEALAMGHMDGATAYPFRIDRAERTLDFAPMWAPMLDDIAAGKPASRIAANIHLTVADAVMALAAEIAAEHKVRDIALSGGVAQNRILREALAERCRTQGFNVLLHHKIPPNDGGLSFGQALIAASR